MTLRTTLIEFDITHYRFKEISLSDFILNKNDTSKIYWIHCNLNQPDDLNHLSKKLNLPDHFIQLCKQKDNIPKLIDDGESLTVQMECLLQNKLAGNTEINFGNLFFHLTATYCFTAASTAIPALSTFVETYPKSVKYAKTPCFILFLILDDATNDFSKLLLDFELIADQMDLELHEPRKNIYSKVMHRKKQVMKIQHHIAIIRDLLMRMSGRKISAISEACRLSLENLLDHSQIIFHEADAIREILKNILDQLENALMQKMNNTMKVLTAFAAIFLPLSLIAGIYGMNFDWMPELHWKYGYFWALGLMVFLGALLIFLFRKMKWF